MTPKKRYSVTCAVCCSVLLASAALSKPVSAATRTPAKKSSVIQNESLDRVFAEIKPVVEKYYPKAKWKRTPDSIHFEFKTRQYADVNSGRNIEGPALDGVLCNIKMKPGKFESKHMLPFLTNETFYVTLLLAPYSASKNSHLETNLIYPHNAPLSFVREFKEALSYFENDGNKAWSSPSQTIPVSPPVSSQAKKSESATNLETQSKTSEVAASSKGKEKQPDHAGLSSDEDATTKLALAAPLSGKKNDEQLKKVLEDNKDGKAKEVSLDASLKTELEKAAGDNKKDESPGKSPSENSKKEDSTSLANASPPQEDEGKEIKIPAKPKPPPKPTNKYFQAWFTKFFGSLEKASYIQQVTVYFSTGFRRQNLSGLSSLNTKQSLEAYKGFRSTCYLSDWRIDKIKPGPGGCTDVILLGRLVGRLPSYMIYRMVPENGTWKIDSGRGRAWKNR